MSEAERYKKEVLEHLERGEWPPSIWRVIGHHKTWILHDAVAADLRLNRWVEGYNGHDSSAWFPNAYLLGLMGGKQFSDDK
jgi:hypothetical protein